MPRQKPRRTDLDTRLRNMTEILGRPGLAGLSRVGGQFSGNGTGQSVLFGTGSESDTEATGAAQLLVLSAGGDSIASGGDFVEFDTIVDQHGFDGVVQAQGGYWVHPISGVYVLSYEHAWTEYDGGGTIRLELDGVLIAGGLIAAADNGREGAKTISYVASAGSVGRIKVTQSSGFAQACDAVARIAVSDPTEAVSEAAAPETGTWTKVMTADTWGLTHDGTNFWTTEGGSGETVSERNAAGTELSSFEAPAVGGSLNRVRGITWDGSNLWVLGASDSVGEYSTAGVLQSSFSLWEDSPQGVAWDGADLWITGNHTQQARRYSTAGVHQQTISLPIEPYGIAYYDGNLYIVDRDNALAFVYALNGTQGTSIDLSGAVTAPNGIWVDPATGDLYVSKDADGVYKRNDPIT